MTSYMNDRDYQIDRLKNGTWLERAIIAEISKINPHFNLPGDLYERVIRNLYNMHSVYSLSPKARDKAIKKSCAHIYFIMQEHLPEYANLLELSPDGFSIQYKKHKIPERQTK
jgi:hypothetical protein